MALAFSSLTSVPRKMMRFFSNAWYTLSSSPKPLRPFELYSADRGTHQG